jgi:hypothetical protein
MTFRDRYFEALGISDKSKLPEVRKLAHDIRQFEIELYWKRATYFWAFQLVAFTALGLLVKDGEIKAMALLLIPSSIGVITALAGLLTARGSKFWQENWEAHVDLLEDETKERLTQVVMCRKAPQYSVTRVNESLLLLIMLGWAVVLVFGAIPQSARLLGFSPLLRGISVLLAVGLACGLMWRSNKTDITGRMYRFGGANWTEYPPRRNSAVPFIIWRDPVGERGARPEECSPDVTPNAVPRQSPH